MSNSWQKYKFSDAPVAIIDGDRGKNYPKQNEFFEKGHCLFLNANNVIKGGFSFESMQFITKEKDELLRSGKLRRGDIVFTTRGTIGNVAYYNNNVPFEHVRINSGMVIFRCEQDKILPALLFQLLRSPFFQSQINAFKSGVAQPQLPICDIKYMTISIPSLTVQCKISSILSAYDDLIENNARRIKILEEMCQRIYQEWFVNFRFPGYKKVKFTDSELGKIPEGWEVTSLGNVCNIEKNKYKETEHSALPLLDLARIPRKSLAINSLGLSCELKTSRIIFKKGSVLFGSIRPYFHKVFYTFCDGVTNTSVFVIKPIETIPVSFLFSLLFSEDSVNWANQNSGGTKMPVISWNVFKIMKIILPDKNLLNKKDSIVSSFLDNICILNLKSLKLRQTRDLLLPKLISGELDISDLDIVVRKEKV